MCMYSGINKDNLLLVSNLSRYKWLSGGFAQGSGDAQRVAGRGDVVDAHDVCALPGGERGEGYAAVQAFTNRGAAEVMADG